MRQYNVTKASAVVLEKCIYVVSLFFLSSYFIYWISAENPNFKKKAKKGEIDKEDYSINLVPIHMKYSS